MGQKIIWIIVGLAVVAGIITTVILLTRKSSTDNTGGGGGGGDSGGTVSAAVAKPKLIAGEKSRIKNNFSDIKDFLPLLDQDGNDYSITNVATCVGTNLSNRVATGELDLNDLLDQMSSPDLSSPAYSAIVQEETNCGYNTLMNNAEHIAMYQHCVTDDVCTVKDLTSFFNCFIGDSDTGKPAECLASDNSLCLQQCSPQDLVRRKMRAKHRAQLPVMGKTWHDLI